MLGIVANFIAYLLFGVMSMTGSQGWHIFLSIVNFILIAFGFNYSREVRSETGSCLYAILLLLNEIASGLMLLLLGGFWLMQCGIL
jgi:hypothetical protein